MKILKRNLILKEEITYEDDNKNIVNTTISHKINPDSECYVNGTHWQGRFKKQIYQSISSEKNKWIPLESNFYIINFQGLGKSEQYNFEKDPYEDCRYLP